MENITLSKKSFVTVLLLLLIPVIGFAQTFDSNANYVVPAGVTSITIEAWGGGGKGGTQSSSGGAGGGGGGGYTRKVFSVTPGQVFNLNVGAGSSSTSAGGTTTVSLGGITQLTANGGYSVGNNVSTGANGGTASGGDVNYTGGRGANAGTGFSGGGGSSGGTNSNGQNGSSSTGGSVTGGGSGGNGRSGYSNNNGYAGGTPGGGGGGAYRTSGTKYGGNGGGGRVVITVNAPEINVQGNGSTIADGDTTPTTGDWTNFGSADISLGSVSRTFTIQNTGTLTLNVTGVSITGTHAADFSVTTSPASTVAPGSSTTFVVTFDPSATGSRNATVTITNNDSNESSYDFAILGTGTTEPEMDLQGNGVTIADNDTTPSTDDWTHFGDVEYTVGTAVRTYTIYNTGTANLTLGALTIGGTHASNFSYSGYTNPTTVPPGGSTSFNVTFNPSTTGNRTASISIANNDPNENPYNFNIQGTGTAPEIGVFGNLIAIASGDMSASVSDNTDFGTVSIDAGSTLVTYTIRNTGTGNLNVGGVTFAGPAAGDFSVYSPPASVVAAGGSTTFIVSFNPTTVGAKVAYLLIANDDANESNYNFQIIGLGVRTYPDTDGDNISDNLDIDDDNDGIPDTMEQAECILSPLSSSTTYTFLNETFGTGTTRGLINVNIPGASCSYCYEDGIVGPDYGACNYQYLSTLNDGEYVVINSIFDHGWTAPEDHTPNDVNGRMAVFNASYDPGTFYETSITGIMPNVPVTYSFWVLNIMPQVNYVGSILPNITVEFLDTDNNVISTYNTGDIGRCDGGIGVNTCAANQWQQFTTTVNLGSVTTFTIRFKNNAPGGGGNDLAIDDITLRQQYCDRDGDGIADLFDLDSDNDGIPDIEEAGFKALSSGLATMDRTLPDWADANTNGLCDLIDTMVTGGTYSIPDSDGDGVKDFHDLDSDNDAQFDVDESNLFNGDGDINGDGFGDGIDTDKDGILDLYDNNNAAFGTNFRPFATDTDNDGTPDYLEIDANTDGVKDILTTLYGSFDANLDGVIDGSTDVDMDGILDSFDTNTSKYGSPRNLNRKLFLDFDGRNDYGEAAQLTSGLAKSTIMAWIKLSNPYTDTGYVIGQDNFHLRIDMSAGEPRLIATAKGVSTTYTVAFDTDRWYHICAVYDGTSDTEKLKLYVNGRLEKIQNHATLAGTLPASTGKFTFGRNPAAANGYFKGSIDEVRIFNTALTTDQIQKMVYQEIKQQGASIRGEVIPKNIESAVWFNLVGYYRMDAYKDDVIDNQTTATIDSGTATNLARIYNHKVISPQLAPMPFVTTLSAPLEVAVSQNNFVEGNDLFTYDWSILKVRHNIDLPYNLTGIGLLIDPSITVNLTNDNKIQNNWYMRLDGKLDLQGRSQLVQGASSDLDVASAGFIERDQQGQTNKWNYNYWAMPVGATNTTSNNNPQTVASLMKDGTNPANPQNIQWTSGLNSMPTTPITLSSYWIFKFQNVANNYANWSSVGPNGTLTAGQGFTLKGSSAATPTQNYTFTGKPNNGTVLLPISANNLNLCGNPYASAIDADVFITDNLDSTTGVLYFWEHFDTNYTHVLVDYQGGYATRTLVGGTPPVAPEGISGLGASTKVAGRYIPVGQGFFVTGSATGGDIEFNNAQRIFVKENDANSNTLFRPAQQTANTANSIHNNNEDPHDEGNEYVKIRLGYTSVDNFHRQILLGFMEEKATAGFDHGYDAKHIDSQPSDMYFVLGSDLLNIQGDGYFNPANIYPIGVKNVVAGNASFMIDGLENFDENQPVYIYDAETGIYHDIREEKFTIALPAGTNNTRFSLRFTDGSTSLGTDEMTLESNIFVTYASANSTINIRNGAIDATVQTVQLYNMLGQAISSWDVEAQDQSHIEIPVKNLSTGTYIVKIKTTKGDISKKVIIK